MSGPAIYGLRRIKKGMASIIVNDSFRPRVNTMTACIMQKTTALKGITD